MCCCGSAPPPNAFAKKQPTNRLEVALGRRPVNKEAKNQTILFLLTIGRDHGKKIIIIS